MKEEEAQEIARAYMLAAWPGERWVCMIWWSSAGLVTMAHVCMHHTCKTGFVPRPYNVCKCSHALS